LVKNQEVQVNFSRKIQRPNFFQLMPFIMFADKQNYRIGNPQLKPEFKNIAEINYNNIFSNGSYLGSCYFRAQARIALRKSVLKIFPRKGKRPILPLPKTILGQELILANYPSKREMG
jgi:hypothetical protein